MPENPGRDIYGVVTISRTILENSTPEEAIAVLEVRIKELAGDLRREIWEYSRSSLSSGDEVT